MSSYRVKPMAKLRVCGGPGWRWRLDVLFRLPPVVFRERDSLVMPTTGRASSDPKQVISTEAPAQCPCTRRTWTAISTWMFCQVETRYLVLKRWIRPLRRPSRRSHKEDVSVSAAYAWTEPGPRRRLVGDVLLRVLLWIFWVLRQDRWYVEDGLRATWYAQCDRHRATLGAETSPMRRTWMADSARG